MQELPCDDANAFAAIIRGDAPAHRVLEDEVALAILDIYPQTLGHTLVIPKQTRATSLLNLEPEIIGPLAERVRRVAKLLVQSLEPAGLEIQQYNGVAAGQTVCLFHFHLLPRYPGITLKSHGATTRVSDYALSEVAARIGRTNRSVS